MARGTNVGGIYGTLDLDNSGFKGVLSQSQQEMAKSALAMQKSSKIKIDLAEWKKLSGQLQALQARAMDVRKSLLAAPAGTPEAKKLGSELKNLEQKIRAVKAVTEPTRKELERLARANKEAAAAGGSFKPVSQIASGLAERLPGSGAAAGAVSSVVGAGAMSEPHIMAIVAALALMTAAATAAGLAVKTLADITRDAVTATGRYAEEMLNLSAKTGISTTQLQQMKYVSDVAGISFEGMTRGVRMLIRQIPDLEKGTSAGAVALSRLGLSVRDSSGELKSMDVLFPQIISKLQGIGNVTERNALAAQLFGRGWAEIAPILSMSAGDLGALMEEAKKLGVVLDSKELKQAAELDDQFDRLAAAAEGMKRQLGAAVAPALLEAADAIAKDLPGYIEDAKQAFNAMQPYIKDFADALKEAYEAAKPLMKAMAVVVGSEIIGHLRIASALFEGLGNILKGLAIMAERARDAINSVRMAMGLLPINWTAPRRLEETEDEPGGGTGVDAEAMEESIALAERAAQRMTDLRREMYLNGDATAYTAMKWEVLNGEFKDANEQTKQQLLTTAKQKDAQDAARKAAEQSATAARDAINKYIDGLEQAFRKQQEWARKMADSMRRFADETVDAVKDQLRKEKDAKDAALDSDRSRYERLRDMGRAGAVAMTKITMFGKKDSGKSESAADFTPERVGAAAAAVAANRQKEADISGLVQKQLYGNSIGQYESYANAKGPDFDGMKNSKGQLDSIIKFVSDIPRVVEELKKINRPAVETGIRG